MGDVPFFINLSTEEPLGDGYPDKSLVIKDKHKSRVGESTAHKRLKFDFIRLVIPDEIVLIFKALRRLLWWDCLLNPQTSFIIHPWVDSKCLIQVELRLIESIQYYVRDGRHTDLYKWALLARV